MSGEGLLASKPSFQSPARRSLTAGLLAGISRLLVVTATTSGALAVHSLPSGFNDPIVFSDLTYPMAVRFAADGRIFVAEKSGLIKVYNGLGDTSPDTFADLRTNVHDFWDRGLLGMTLDPDFPAQPYVYVLYAFDYDINTPSIPPPRWGDECLGSPNGPGPTADGCVISGRLSRLEIRADNTLDGSEHVLLEDNWCQQYPSHSLGALNFGPEGALYLTAGDGASFTVEDFGQGGGTVGNPPYTPRNPCGDPPSGRGGAQSAPSAQGGALRSQDLRTSGDPVTYDGAVLRLDPVTGGAWPDNPLVGGDPGDDRIIAYGLRNPFRATFRPGTSELWIGDVGWGDWEEVDRLINPFGPTIENFGWPCYEGAGRQPGYDARNLSICESLYSAGAGAVVSPYYAYNHASDVDPLGDGCRSGGSSISGLAFYTTGIYPATYFDALFFADYSRDCIYVMRRGANGLPDLATRTAFVVDAFNPVDVQRGPGGDVFYADFDGGAIRRITYNAGNSPPIAVAQASATSGPVPLVVQFDGASSTDPDPGATVFYAWDLDGDGQYDDATIVDPGWSYNTPGVVTVGLRVTDDDGASDTDSIVISVGNSAPTAAVLAPLPTQAWRVGDRIEYAGDGDDFNDGFLPPSAMHWEIILHHCPGGSSDCHPHVVEQHDGIAGGSFFAPDHEWYSRIEFELTVTDSGGLVDTASVSVDPVTVTNAYQSTPAGMQLVLGGIQQAAPFDRPAIVGSTNSLIAVSPQTLGATQYYWSSWSDGGPQSNEFVAGPGAVTRIASFAVCQGLDVCDGRDNDCDGVADNPPLPAIPGALTVTGTHVAWGSRPEATGYDVVRGDLGALVSAGGDFTGSTGACLANDLNATSLPYTAAPGPGQGFWLLVRAVNCVGVGTYDSGAPSQTGSRDAEIEASAPACASGDVQPPTAPGSLVASVLPVGVSLSWAASNDDLGVSAYNVHRASTPGVVPTEGNQIGQTGATHHTDSGLSSGTYYYVVTAQDAAANVSGPSNEASATVAADSTPPTVSITSPPSGSALSGTVTVTASASDDVGVLGVQFLLDGAPLGPEDTTAPHSFPWNTSSSPSGAHTLSARARDAAANVGTAPGVNVTTGGLVAAYSFNEGSGTTAGDSSGNGNHGATAGPAWTGAGKYGSALAFDGVNDWVIINDSASLDLTTGMTLEAWVHPTVPLSSWVTTVAKDVDSYYLMASSPQGSAPAVGGTFVAGNQNTYGTAALTPNVWTHLAATFDGATVRLYVNGSPAASQAQTTPLTTSSNAVHVGGNFYGEWFQGRIDEVRIYNRPLGQLEIQNDMNAPLP